MADSVPTPDETRSTKLVELRSELDQIDAELLALLEKPVLDEAEEERAEDLNTRREVVKAEHDKLEARAARAQEIKQKKYREIYNLPDPRTPAEEMFHRSVVNMGWKEARDGALRILNDKDANFLLESDQGDQVDSLVRSSSDVARRVIATENEHYRSAWSKYVNSGNGPLILTPEEAQALVRYQEYRAASEGTTTMGGMAVPVFIDPSVILTAQGSDNPFLRLCRVETVTTNIWKGVSSAGVSWSFDAEAVEVSDDAITIAQPTVNVNMARGFIPYSIEVGYDWPGFAAEMGRVLAEGYDELLVSKFTTGTGTNEPKGIITALDANTNSEVLLTTAGQFGQEDVYKTWKGLGQRFRRRANWLMCVDTNNRIRQFATANVFHAFTQNLPAEWADTLFGKTVYEDPYFTDFTATTAHQNVLIVGDFQNYLIARGVGMSVETIPHLFSTTTNLPSGQRGLFAFGRIGGNSVNDLGFRLLNQT